MEGGGHVSLVFEDVRVPLANVIGKLGEGMPRALGNIGNVRMMVSAQAVGMCVWTLEFIENRFDAHSGVKHIVDDQQRIFLVDLPDEVAQPVYLDVLGGPFNARVV